MVSSWSLDSDGTSEDNHLSMLSSTAGEISIASLQFLMMITREAQSLMGALPAVLGLCALKASPGYASPFLRRLASGRV